MVARRGNYRSGEEHGSARWATPRELRRLSDEASPDDNILLTQNVRLAMSRDDHDPRWERNRNVVVIGGSGSGKTRTYVEPNLMQMNASYLVTDPKGTTVRKLGGMLAAHGYDVRTLNTVDFSLSMRYNPLAYVRTQQDVLELVECLIVNTTPKGKSANDPFWENSERLLYCALIGYLTYHCPPEDRTLPGLMTLLSLAEARDEDESFMSPLDVLFRELETGCRCVAAPGAAGGDGRSMGGARESVRWVPWCDPATPDSDYALGRYRAFKAAAGKTLKSIIISCNARLSALASEELKDILSADDMRLDTLGDPGQRAAIFATTSDTNATYSFLLAMLMWQAGNVLCERALTEYGGELPTPVHLVLDEFANIGRLPDFERTIAVVRSRNIGVSVVLSRSPSSRAPTATTRRPSSTAATPRSSWAASLAPPTRVSRRPSARRPSPPAPTTRPGARPRARPPTTRPPSATSSRPPRWEGSTDAAPSCSSPARTPCAT
jgi:type IV secretion system protein VirD4